MGLLPLSGWQGHARLSGGSFVWCVSNYSPIGGRRARATSISHRPPGSFVREEARLFCSGGDALGNAGASARRLGDTWGQGGAAAFAWRSKPRRAMRMLRARANAARVRPQGSASRSATSSRGAWTAGVHRGPARRYGL